MTQLIRILAVEDQKLLRDTLVHVLAGEGSFSVVADFGSGKEALRFLEQHQADLVLLDRLLPDMNGLALTRILKEKYPAIKILMMSMISDETSVRKAFEAGVDGYLPKEIGIERLIASIHQVMEGQKVTCYLITTDLIKLFP